MRVVGDHKHAVSQHGDPAIDSTGRIARQPLTARPALVPDLAPIPRIESIRITDRRKAPDAIHHNWRYLKRARRTRNPEDPLRCELLHVGGVDLVQGTEAVAA